MPNQVTPSDEALLRRAREGDDRAFRVLVERYEALVAATVQGMLGRGPDAEDVGQVTFVRFHVALDRFRGDASVGTYLTRIAINESLKALERRKRWTKRFLSRDQAESPIEPASPEPDASERLESRESAAAVHAAIRDLTPKLRATVVLRMLDGFSTRETAQILGVPEGTVLSRLSRALGRLRVALRPHLGGDEE